MKILLHSTKNFQQKQILMNRTESLKNLNQDKNPCKIFPKMKNTHRKNRYMAMLLIRSS